MRCHVAILMLALSGFAGAAEREWTDKTGEHKLRGELSDIVVQIKRRDGTTVGVSIKNLSDADRHYLAEWLVTTSPPPKAKPMALDDAIIALRRAGHDVSNGNTMVIFRGKTTAAQVALAQHIPTVRELSFSYQADDKALSGLGTMTGVEILSINWSDVSDDGLRHLAALPNVRWLKLNSPAVTDAGLIHLRSLKKLEKLELIKTKVTKGGIEGLYKFLPKCVATLK